MHGPVRNVPFLVIRPVAFMPQRLESSRLRNTLQTDFSACRTYSPGQPWMLHFIVVRLVRRAWAKSLTSGSAWFQVPSRTFCGDQRTERSGKRGLPQASLRVSRRSRVKTEAHVPVFQIPNHSPPTSSSGIATATIAKHGPIRSIRNERARKGIDMESTFAYR